MLFGLFDLLRVFLVVRAMSRFDAHLAALLSSPPLIIGPQYCLICTSLRALSHAYLYVVSLA